MKKCPQCNSVFADDNRYCLNDGTILVEENLPLPTTVTFNEQDTIVKSKPLIVDIAPPNMPSPYQNPSAQETIILNAPPPKKVSKVPKYVLFLFLGLLIGGGFVFGAFLLAGKFYQRNTDTAASNVNSSVKNKPVKTNTDSSSNNNSSSDDSGEYNGRVIAINANLRSEPGLYAEEIGVLPIDERINIVRREHSNSPWYYVEAENGESGWIHGNTIEFTR